MPSLDLCPTLAEMLETKRTVGRSGKVFPISGSGASTMNNLAFIRRAMRERKPVRTLETGLQFGASTLTFCFEHQQLGRQGARQHIAIDPYEAFPWIDESGVHAVERAGLSEYLDYRPEFSEFVLPRLLEGHDRFDFIYLDGSHNFENVLIDAFYAARLLNDGGLIAFDDSTDPHVAKVLGFIRSNLTGALKEVWNFQSLRSAATRLLRRNQLTVFERLPYSGEEPKNPLRDLNSPFARF